MINKLYKIFINMIYVRHMELKFHFVKLQKLIVNLYKIIHMQQNQMIYLYFIQMESMELQVN